MKEYLLETKIYVEILKEKSLLLNVPNFRIPSILKCGDFGTYGIKKSGSFSLGIKQK